MEEEFVISGIAGRFPMSNNLEEFWENLIEGKDMVSEDNRRWDLDGFKVPRRAGKLENVDKFDADFFAVHSKQAEGMDPRLKFVLELTHEALLDAGINPTALRGSKTGVFVGAAGEEALSIWKHSSENPNCYCSLGTPVSMLSNRISFAFDFHGPSYTLDSSCSASTLALQNALLALKNGQCDSAIVSGVQIAFCPLTSVMFKGLELTSTEGMCKAFDSSGKGYVRSEAAVVLYICRKGVAKRSYATVVHAKCNSDGWKEQGITFPSGALQEQLLREVYAECGVSPLEVAYVEAHGTGTKAGDPQEVNALTNVFCEGRQRPLLIGSVKSNMGHAEVASGMAGLAKILLFHHFGQIPANLHYQTPNPDIPGLVDGRLKVVAENTTFKGNYVALSSFGFGGTNVHVLLKLTPKNPSLGNTDSPIPKLILASGRTYNAVEYQLKRILAHDKNSGLVGLIHEIYKNNIHRHPFRGYAIGSKIEIQNYNEIDRKPEIWFVFTGLGSQWLGMAKDMMCFEAFKKSIEKSSKVLLKNGFDLMEVLCTKDSEVLNNLKNSIVSITCVQIALVSLLASVGIHPEGIIGHSTGECASAYADGCFTHEQAILVSLGRARAFLESDLPPGTVASVALSWEEAVRRCPEGIYPAIHNSKENVTIAGPPESVRNFLEELRTEGIFAKEVKSACYGFHSPYVSGAEKLMREFLEKVIPSPKLRSAKWLSSSIEETLWGSELAKFSSVDYHVNNALSPVHFYATLQHIPGNSIVLEIGPHPFMQTILKQVLPPSTLKLGLMNKSSEDNREYFLESLGKLYQFGVNFDAGKLYDAVQFPVDPTTPLISPMVKWDHSATWPVPNIKNVISKSHGGKCLVDLTQENYSYIVGHKIDGRVLFPATGYIWLVWKIFAEQQNGASFENLPVVLEDLRFERSTIIPVDGAVEFIVRIFPGNGQFEVTERNQPVFRGVIRLTRSNLKEETFPLRPVERKREDQLDKGGFYKELRLRGYEYSGIFKGVHSIDIGGNWAEVEWNDNWVSFLDTILQTGVLRKTHRGLYLPIRLEKVTIDPKVLKGLITQNVNLLGVINSENLETVQCAGVEFRGLKVSLAPRRSPNKDDALLFEHKFIPYFPPPGTITTPETLEFLMGIAIDNVFHRNFIFTEILTRPCDTVSNTFLTLCPPKFEAPELRLAVVKENDELPSNLKSRVMRLPELEDLEPSHLIFTDILESVDDKLIQKKGFIIYQGIVPACGIPKLSLVSKIQTLDNTFSIYRKFSNTPSQEQRLISLDDTSSYEWMDDLKMALKSSNDQQIILKSENTSGILGLVKCLAMEPGYENIRCLFIIDDDFHLDEATEQLKLDLVFNVRKNNSWGCFASMKMSEKEFLQPRPNSEAYVNALVPGDLTSLAWIQSPPKIQGKKYCEIHFASLNFRDVMLATGKLARDALPGASAFDDCVLGLEFSGIFNSKKIFGLHKSKCLATSIEPDESLLWEVPETWDLVEAATVPVVYATAYYALLIRGGMRPGETVLIHAGAGGVGQAAITLALSMNCTVYTTVGSVEKREFLLNRFPELKPENISDSRKARDFEKCVREGTRGEGVNIVLNSLAEDKLYASIRCLAKYGRFLEIGKLDLYNDSKFGMSTLLKSVNIQGILLDQVLEGESTEKFELVQLIQAGILSGVVKPLPCTSFGTDQLEDAFRFMASGKHIGKVVMDIQENRNLIQALPRMYFHPHKVYILIGGLGGMGLEISHWMIQRGARHLILNSRSGIQTAYQRYRISVFRESGVNVILDQSDVATAEGATHLIQSAVDLGPLGGILNVSLVLNDGLFENQSAETFKATCKSKVCATIQLDRASRTLAQELDYFVVFSSIVAARGNAGQTNYGYANSYMERICEQRRKHNLPAIAIQWGLIGDVGVVSEASRNTSKFSSLAPQKIESWLQTFEALLLHQHATVVTSMVLAEKETSTKSQSKPESLVQAVANILAIKDISKINPKTTLIELGMDSLMSAEIKQVLDSKRNILLPINAYGQLTFEKIMQMELGASTKLVTQPIMPQSFELQPMPREVLIQMKSVECPTNGNLFIVHPIDGTVHLLQTLAAHLETKVFGLQCTPEAPLTSMEDLARFYVKQIQKIQSSGPYKIAGYSFGSAVAFEMALQLEHSGFSVALLLLLDGCPKWQEFFTKNFIEKGIQNDEDSWMTHFMNLYMSMSDQPKIEKELKKLGSFHEKAFLAASKLKEVYEGFEVEELVSLAKTFAGRLKIGYSYDPVGKKVKARTVLVRAGLGGFDKILGPDYDLARYCYNKVEVIEVAGHHHCFHENLLELGIPSILNKLLNDF